MDVWVFNAARLVFATAALGLCAWLESQWNKSQGNPKPTTPYSRTRVLLFSLTAGLLYQWVFVLGIFRTTAGNTALLLATMPMWTAVISYLFIHERLSRITWIGLGMTFVGAVIVTTQKGNIDFSSQFFVGNLLMLSAAMTWAAGTVLSRSLLSVVSPLKLAFWSSLLTTPVHLLLAFSRGTAAWEPVLEPKIFGAVLYSGVLSTGLAYASWHVGVRQLGGSHASVYQNIVTLVAVGGSWIFLHEQPQWVQLLGGVCMLLGMYWMRRGRHASSPPAAVSRQTP